MWLIKHPETQPHAVVMREQRVLFLFSCNHSLTLYSSIQSVKEVAVLPGIWQTNHPGKQTRGWSAIQEKSLKCGEQQHHWPSQVVSRQCWVFFTKNNTVIILPFFFQPKKPGRNQSGKWQAEWNLPANQSVNKPVSQQPGQSLRQPMTQTTRHGLLRIVSIVVKDVPSDSVNSFRNEHVLLCFFICHYGSPPASVGSLLNPFPRKDIKSYFSL